MCYNIKIVVNLKSEGGYLGRKLKSAIINEEFKMGNLALVIILIKYIVIEGLKGELDV